MRTWTGSVNILYEAPTSVWRTLEARAQRCASTSRAPSFLSAAGCRANSPQRPHVIPAPGPEELEITDRAGLARWFSGPNGAPEAVITSPHGFRADARTDPAEAFRVNVGGTAALFEALRAIGIRPPVLVVGSSEVYGSAAAADLPLTEDSPVASIHPYALSKIGEEAVAIEAATRYGFPSSSPGRSTIPSRAAAGLRGAGHGPARSGAAARRKQLHPGGTWMFGAT